MPVIFLDQQFVVVAVFLKISDATEYASISHHKYCAVPIGSKNRDKLPQVGDTYKV